MKKKKVALLSTAVVLVVAATGAVGVGVYAQQQFGHLDHGTAYAIAKPESFARPATGDGQSADMAQLRERLEALAANPDLGAFHGVVTNSTTGEQVWQQQASEPLTPASSTKVLTAAAAILTLDLDERIVTKVVAGEEPGSVIIKAAGDVWLTSERLDTLAADVRAALDEESVTTVYIDTTAWQGEEYLPGWDPSNVDEGYVAPLQPAMINGGRIGATTGDVPRSHTPALDVAAALAQRLDASNGEYATAPAGARVLASTESEPLALRMRDMLLHSDNVMAEAIGREVAIARGAEPTSAAATFTTLEILRQLGLPVDGTQLNDNSGLSVDNRITPALLGAVVDSAADGDALRPLLTMLPVAYGEGTLGARYADLPGRGWVRAKTGTLTGVSALVGTVTGTSGTVYTFALLSNDSDITAARAGLDEFASELRLA